MENTPGRDIIQGQILENEIGEGVVSSDVQSIQMEADIALSLYEENIFRDEIIILSNPESSPSEVDKAMKSLPLGTLRNYTDGTSGRPHLLGSLTELLARAGLHPRNNRGDVKYVYHVLQELSFPVERRTIEATSKGKTLELAYYFYWKGMEGVGVDVLRDQKGEKFEAMSKPSIRVLGPKRNKRVTTTDLRDKERFMHALNSIRDFIDNPGKLLATGYKNVAELVGDSPPVPVYFSTSGTYIEASDEAVLREFFISRIFS